MQPTELEAFGDAEQSRSTVCRTSTLPGNVRRKAYIQIGINKDKAKAEEEAMVHHAAK